MTQPTADLSDRLEDTAQIAAPVFRDYGGRVRFSGPLSTVKCFEDNSLVRAALEERGNGRVLVVDGGGSMRCALLGDELAALAAENGWSGVVVNGCIRDSEAIAGIDLGVKALATIPRKSVKRGHGERDLLVRFAEVSFNPRHYLYADADGVLITARKADDG